MGSINWVPLRDDVCKGDQILHTSIKKEDTTLIKLNSFMLTQSTSKIKRYFPLFVYSYFPISSNQYINVPLEPYSSKALVRTLHINYL